MVGRDTPEPIRLWRPCKTSHVKAVIVNQESPCFSCGECQWEEKNRDAVKSLETVLGAVQTIEKEKENRFYVKRTDIVQRTLQEHEKNGKEEAT